MSGGTPPYFLRKVLDRCNLGPDLRLGGPTLVHSEPVAVQAEYRGFLGFDQNDCDGCPLNFSKAAGTDRHSGCVAFCLICRDGEVDKAQGGFLMYLRP